MSFELVQTEIDALAPDGKAVRFTVTLFEQIVVRSRFIGIVLLLVSGILYIGRKKAQEYISNILTSFSSFSIQLVQYFDEVIRKEDKVHLTALLIILLLAVVVRLFFLFQPIRYDEAFTFTNYASKPLFLGLSNFSYPNNHLFHTLLVHIAYLLFGNQPWVIRLPAFFAGIFLVAASYMVIRIFYNKYAALLTTGFVASSPVLILYSTNARGYILVYLIFLLILSLGTYLLQNRNPTAWFLFAILSALGFYTIPVMLYPFGIVVVWLFLSIIFQNTKLSYKLLLKDLGISLIIAVLLTFFLYVPVFIISGLKSVVASRFVTSKPWSGFISNLLPYLTSVWNQWNKDIPTVIRLFLVMGFFTSLFFHKRLTNYRIPIMMTVFIWCIPVLIVQRVFPPARVWLFLLPLYLGLASSGMIYLLKPIESRIFHHKSVLFAMIAVTISFWLSFNVVNSRSVYYSNETGTLRDAEQISALLKGYLRPGDIVFAVCPSDSPLEYYFNLYNIPVAYLFSDLGPEHDRLLVVVNESAHQTLKGILDEKGLSGESLSLPKVIRRYESATLYEVKKHESVDVSFCNPVRSMGFSKQTIDMAE